MIITAVSALTPVQFDADSVIVSDKQGRPLVLAFYHADQLILKTVLDADFAGYCKLFGATPPTVERVAIGP